MTVGVRVPFIRIPVKTRIDAEKFSVYAGFKYGVLCWISRNFVLPIREKYVIIPLAEPVKDPSCREGGDPQAAVKNGKFSMILSRIRE